jgi:hypothetical protein
MWRRGNATAKHILPIRGVWCGEACKLHATPHQTPRISKNDMLPHHHIATYEYSHFNLVILTRNT